MQIINISLNDKLHMKKTHPCGSEIFEVKRIGSDVRVVCSGCGRDLTITREKLERMIKKVIRT